MTIERKIVFSLEEITALVLECARAGCGRRVVTSFSDLFIPERCTCGQEWFLLKGPTSRDAGPTSPLKELTTSFSNMLATNKGSVGVRVLFEINEPTK